MTAQQPVALVTGASSGIGKEVALAPGRSRVPGGRDEPRRISAHRSRGPDLRGPRRLE